MISADWQKIAQLTTHPRTLQETAAINKSLHLRRNSIASEDSCLPLSSSDRWGIHNKKWFLPTKKVSFPAEYIDALTEIALEWQETKLASLPSNDVL